MYRTVSCLLLLLFAIIGGEAAAAEVKIFAEINHDGAYEDQPLKGTVSITHDMNDAVATDSFRLGQDKLNVDFVKDVRISPPDPTVLSIYTFVIPGKIAGLYALPSVSVQVGTKTYYSVLSSYTVIPRPKGWKASSAASSSSAQAVQPVAQENVSLRLEAEINGKSTLYPGERTEFVYRYFFQGNIGLTLEKLPLLDGEGFIKIGEKEFTDNSEGDVSINRIAQQVEAVKPGTYTFGPSEIEGYAYQKDAGGNPVYTSSKLVSEAPAVTVTVLPFPEKGKPASFNGAIGEFLFKTELVSSSEVDLGDEISLALYITGKREIRSVPLPDLCCQPGFSGFFKQSDLPPVEEVKKDTKKSIVKLRVLSDQIKEIPSVEFSYFDPDGATYSILHSAPIQIKVHPSGAPNKKEQIESSSAPTLEKLTISSQPSPIEIESIPTLSVADLHNRPFGTWWVVVFVPAAAALLVYQLYIKRLIIEYRGRSDKETSLQLFQEAFSGPGRCDYDRLRRSLLLALAEAKQILSGSFDDAFLSDEGVTKEVKNFFLKLDEQRFSGQGEISKETLQAEAKALLNKIKGGS